MLLQGTLNDVRTAWVEAAKRIGVRAPQVGLTACRSPTTMHKVLGKESVIRAWVL
jgi:hypothetical protein